MKQFYNVLVNTLIANVTTSYLWFALTFWVYLETRSVMATAIIGGSYMLLAAIGSLFFGTIVDQNKKKRVMVASTVIALAMYLLAGIVYLFVVSNPLSDWQSPFFWLFGGIILFGAVVENMRNIALSTTVTLLVPKEGRDEANGLVGTVQGLAFLVTAEWSPRCGGLELRRMSDCHSITPKHREHTIRDTLFYLIFTYTHRYAARRIKH